MLQGLGEWNVVLYLIDCKNLDQAIKWAAKIPTARYGTIEVRPVMVFEQEN